MTVLARKRTIRTYRCGECGVKITAQESLYSRWTGAHYCADLVACIKRTTAAETKAAKA